MKKVVILTLVLTSIIGECLAQEMSEKVSIEWKRGEDIPLARGGYFAAWLDGGLWLAGGSYWKDGKKLWTAEASFYDPRTGKWSTAKPIPKAIGYGATAVVGEDLFLLGGVDSDGQPNREIHRMRKGKWDEAGESPETFIYPAYATIGSKVYVFGGSSSPTDVTRATNHAWLYDAATQKWESLPPIPGERRQIFSAVAVGKEIFVFGGITQKAGDQPSNLDDAYRFDTKTKSWMKIKKMPIAMRAFWAGTDFRSVFLIGGYSAAGLDTVYRYSPMRDHYELVSRLPQPLMDTKFIFAKDTFYGASGEDKLASRFQGIVIGRVKYDRK